MPESILEYCCKSNEIKDFIHRRVIVATATTSGNIHSLGLHNGHITHLFIDEAGQLTEPDTCVAIG